MRCLCLLVMFLVFPFRGFSQSIIWEENFDKQVGKGVSGDNSGGLIVDLDDVSWTLDYSQCTFSAADDFVKVAPYFSGGRFTARDCNGEAIWESAPINISDYADIQVAVNIGETGSSNNAESKYIKLYTVVDGVEQSFTNNPEGLGNFGSLTASSVISSGSELKIRVKLRTDFSQNVYFDNVKVSGRSNKLDVKLSLVSATEIVIAFNQEMDAESIETIENYTITPEIKVEKAKRLAADSVDLTTSRLRTGKYKMQMQNLKNKVGIVMPDTIVTFDYWEEAQTGEVVLNELMIDPKPAIKLPEYEYIELYNTTEKPFILTDWTITINDKIKTLPIDTIQPNEYLLLCSTAAQSLLEKYGKTLAVSGISALKNTSSTVVLKSASSATIDSVSYKKEWYNDTEKDKGGWSLERIDPVAVSNARSNWSAAFDERGGTPCEKNSVFGIVLDDTPPKIESVVPTSRNQVQLTFNEPIDTLAVQQTQLFFANGLGYPKSVEVSKNEKQVLLNFSETFAYGMVYELEIKEVLDVFGNALENVTVTFGLPELAQSNELIVNEILFNPVAGNVDYVELYNRSEKIFDLAALSIATRGKNNELKSIYAMSADSHLLQPNDFVVLTINPELVEQQYYVKNPEAMLRMKSLPSFPNDAGTVVILNRENAVVDEFHYTEKMHSKLLYSFEGVALERIHYDLPTQEANNWHSAAEIAGFGTPTYQNSAYSERKDFETEIAISPKVFSPNGDGVDDMMEIHYQFENAGNVANVRIFDSMGRLVLVLTRNLILGTEGSITWKGVNANNERARTGRYVILIEIFDEKGNTKTYKRSCVLNGLF